MQPHTMPNFGLDTTVEPAASVLTETVLGCKPVLPPTSETQDAAEQLLS